MFKAIEKNIQLRKTTHGFLLVDDVDYVKFKQYLKQESELLTELLRDKYLESIESKNNIDHIIIGLPALQKRLARMARGLCPDNGSPNIINYIGKSCEFMVEDMNSKKSTRGHIFLTDSFVFKDPTGKVISKISPVNTFRTFKNHMIINGSKRIVLENSENLEDDLIDYMKSTLKDDPFSYICGIRNYKDSDIIGLITEFVESGGSEVVMFTNSYDRHQIKNAFEYLPNIGVKSFKIRLKDTDVNISDIVKDYEDIVSFV